MFTDEMRNGVNAFLEQYKREFNEDEGNPTCQVLAVGKITAAEEILKYLCETEFSN